MAPEEEERYGKLSRAMCKDQRITDTDRTVYAYIKTYINWRVIQTQVATELGKSLSTIKRSINRLDAAGYMAYDIKETDQKRERRSMKMLDKPATWVKIEPCINVQVKTEPLGGSNLNHAWVKNEPYDETQVGQNCTTHGSKMNHMWVKNEPPYGSILNHNVASTLASLTAASPTVAAETSVPTSTKSFTDMTMDELSALAKQDSELGVNASREINSRTLGRLGRISPSDRAEEVVRQFTASTTISNLGLISGRRSAA